MTAEQRAAVPPRLGLRENIGQFSLLVGVNALVGGMIGQERTVLPLLATETFHLSAYTATLTFIAAFGDQRSSCDRPIAISAITSSSRSGSRARSRIRNRAT